MKAITKFMINEYKIKKIGFDFMGYSLQKGDIYNFHHLIIPARKGGLEVPENGAILCGKTSHQYLHLIEHVDLDMFNFITSEMIDQNIKGKLDLYNIRKIHEVLKKFEREHCSDKNYKGKILIKERYYNRVKISN